MKKICVVSSSRADYGLLRHLMREIEASDKLNLKFVVSGSHLSQLDGMTIEEIETDGFKIDAKVGIFEREKNDKSEISKRISNGIEKFGNIYEALKPDFVLLLGDRYEIFSAAISATIAQLPIIHLHGGEVTKGAFDDSFRHSISKMAHIHFVAADNYRKRLIQLGESPENVFCTGGLGVDAIKKVNILSKKRLSETLNIRLNRTSFLVTYHPVTLEKDYGLSGLNNLLNALNCFPEATICFTLPNADTNSSLITKEIKSFLETHSNSFLFSSMGQEKYYSCLKHFSAVIGNSSSGLLEAPSFRIPTINIGKRQNGRLKATSVIDCEPQEDNILNAINLALSPTFSQLLKTATNPYGKGGAAKKIVSVLEKIEPSEVITKNFFDLKECCF